METDINVTNDASRVTRIIKGYSEIEKKWDGVDYYLYPEVGTFNGVLDGNSYNFV